MSTEKLVAAIVDGDAQQIQQSFNQVMADKALEYIDAARQVVAQNMFNVEEEVDYLDEARADSSEKEYRDWSAEDHERESRPGGMYASDRKWHLAQAKKKRKAKNAVKEEVDYLDEGKMRAAKSIPHNEIHVKDISGLGRGTALKVHAVGARWKKHIKPGAILDDDWYGDLESDGAKIKEINEEVDYLDESCAAHELHVQPVKTESGTKYKVLAVGKNFADGIKTGEHLSDTELDDASEIGAKIVRRKG
jgi:hypothetical protein